jgi:pSer/pThr/pTyr-binding forkhead associated (FHA) protein
VAGKASARRYGDVAAILNGVKRDVDSKSNPGQAAPLGPRRFWLEHDGPSIELRRGQLVIGRSSGCHIVIEDNMVSRRHAELRVTDDAVTVHDLGSVNGIYVNGERVRDQLRLKDGDRLQVGQRELTLKSLAKDAVPAVSDRLTAETLHGNMLSPLAQASEDTTHIGDVFDVLGSVADKVLALERGDEAERILSGVLNSVLREATEGRSVSLETAEQAAGYAVRIAGATGRPTWLDYTIQLYATLGKPLPAPIVDKLYDVVRRARGMNVVALRSYVASLQAEAPSLRPAERFVLQRLEGLERVVLS